jgi:hypothetical protein
VTPVTLRLRESRPTVSGDNVVGTPLQKTVGKTRELLDRLGVVKWIMLALVIGGAAMVFWGSREDSYFAAALLEIGAALFLGIPLLLLERVMNTRMSEVQRAAKAAQESIHSVETKVQTVQQDVKEARTAIDELGRATAERISAARAEDSRAIQALRHDPSETNVWGLLNRAQDLEALDPLGVRVSLPGTPFRVRFGALPPDPAARRAAVVRLAVETPDGDELAADEEWSAAEPAADALTRLARELQRAGKYPGDARFDATLLFERLASTLETVLALRTGGRRGAQLGAVVELIGEWALTVQGLEHVDDDRRDVSADKLRTSPAAARAELDAGDGADGDGAFAEAFETAVAYHRGQHRRAAEARLRRPRAG